MAETRAAWGIDIGQSALKALKIRYFEDAGQAVAVAFDYVPYPKILSQPDAIPEEIVDQAMETFLSRNEVDGDLIAISVPGQSALARFIQLPPVETSKLAEIIKYEARQQIPFALEEVIWDYQPLGSGAEESGYLLDAEVGLFAMKRDQVEQQLKPFLDAKLEVELVQIAPLALFNVLGFDELGIRPEQPVEDREEYIIVLDMGCDNTSLLVSNGQKIWVRNVPLGGNHFTRALTKEMKLSFAKAEHLKCNATKSPDPRAVFQALRPVFNDYAAEIQRSIGFFSSVNRQAKIEKVIGVGNGFKLAGLQKFLQQNLQYEVQRPDTYRALAGDAVLNAPLFSDNVLSFTVAYGLAVQALGLTTTKTTLLPPEIATARTIRKKKPWAVAAAASLLFGYAISTVGNGLTYAKPHSDEFAAAQKQAEQLTQEVGGYQTAYSAAESKFQAAQDELAGLVEGRRDLTWLDAYNSILDCLPREEGNEQDETEIEKREMISITHFNAEHVADVAEWYEGLDENQKHYMTEKDKESGPSGEGYIITLAGMHWHYTEDDFIGSGIGYLNNRFLKNLQRQTIVSPDSGAVRDVRRMGITHPAVVKWRESAIEYSPYGVGTVAQNRFSGGLPGGDPAGMARPFGLGPGATAPRRDMRRPTPTGEDDDTRIIKQLDFVIELVFQPIPESERVDVVVEEGSTGEGGEPASPEGAPAGGGEPPS